MVQKILKKQKKQNMAQLAASVEAAYITRGTYPPADAAGAKAALKQVGGLFKNSGTLRFSTGGWDKIIPGSDFMLLARGVVWTDEMANDPNRGGVIPHHLNQVGILSAVTPTYKQRKDGRKPTKGDDTRVAHTTVNPAHIRLRMDPQKSTGDDCGARSSGPVIGVRDHPFVRGVHAGLDQVAKALHGLPTGNSVDDKIEYRQRDNLELRTSNKFTEPHTDISTEVTPEADSDLIMAVVGGCASRIIVSVILN